ncbi:EAL domain-containing protein [Permianibacter sp. IMCC34836]|uniref:putative bifunctional diguanylate cyclase/phosphodiesterase n=1 Tax=Permianibacter fluminis TaxID=2738515 RepID=UPI001557C032|nr:EAL domain-containing protein [Permianibacter fluminis]NQD39083.1 EAL domain-containing protein [Permianibacter fluminis]
MSHEHDSLTNSSAQPSTSALPDASDPALLLRRLEREREARKSAEQLLSEKSRELYQSNETLQRALASMSDAQHRLRLALWGSGEMIWEWDAGTDSMQLHYFNDPDGQETLETVNWLELTARIHPDDFPSAMLSWNAHLFGHAEHYAAEYRAKAPEGWRWVRVRGRATERDRNGMALRISGTRKDITGQRESEDNLRLLAAAFANTRDAIVVLAPDHRVLQANQACADLFGIDMHQLSGTKLDQLLLDSDGQFPWTIWQSQKSWHGELSCLHRKGNRTPVEVASSQVRDSAGELTQIVLSLHDISERRRAAESVERLTRYDAVTQLPNRQQFQERLHHQLPTLRDSEQISVLFLDLDGFKEINDALGHHAGDALLLQVAERLQQTLRKRDLVARWGGDEFAILIESEKNEYLLVAEKIVNAMNDPFQLAGQDITVTTSIGITVAPVHGTDASQLLRQADAAMYAAKREGRNRFALYRPEMNENLLHRVKLSNLLRRAVDNGEFTLALQPKVRLATRSITGAEALLRWEPEELGRVPPATFIPLAEELGLIVPIGHWLIREAAGLLAQWQRNSQAINLAINLSGRQLRDELLFAVLNEAIRLSDAPVKMLELEVTESILLEDITFARDRLQRLRDTGFSIALDDFGTGYSSLSYLKELPLDRVKIDRSFISDLDMSPRGRALLSSIVTLCRALQLEITAEGVETEAQLDLVQAEGIDEVQGYYFYRPMAIPDFNRLLQQTVKPATTP